jgi:hypothetical protein
MRNKKGIEKGTSRDTVLWRGAGALARGSDERHRSCHGRAAMSGASQSESALVIYNRESH